MNKMLNIFVIGTIIVTLCLPAASFAGDDDIDNVLHFGLSMAFGAISETWLHKNHDMSGKSRIVSATLLGSVPGLIKEISDSTGDRGYFSGSDMGLDVAGALTGSVFANYLNENVSISLKKRPHGITFAMSYRY
jgi:putative lipoprotein